MQNYIIASVMLAAIAAAMRPEATATPQINPATAKYNEMVVEWNKKHPPASLEVQKEAGPVCTCDPTLPDRVKELEASSAAKDRQIAALQADVQKLLSNVAQLTEAMAASHARAEAMAAKAPEPPQRPVAAVRYVQPAMAQCSGPACGQAAQGQYRQRSGLFGRR